MPLVSRRLLQKISYSGMRFGFAAGRLAVRVLPARWVFGFSDRLASVAFVLFRAFRRRSLRNIQVAFGQDLEPYEHGLIVSRSLRNFFRACLEIGIALESSADD